MQRGLIAAVALIMLTWLASTETTNKLCSDDKNPFSVYQEFKKFPAERINRGADYTETKNMTEMGFKLIPQEAVKCVENQLPTHSERTSHLNVRLLEDKMGVPEECRNYIQTWLRNVTDTVLHNLLIVIKAKTVLLFNYYFDLKSFVLGPGKLVTDLGDELVDILEDLEQNLKNSSIPSEVETPTYSSYYGRVGRFVTFYTNIQRNFENEKFIELPEYPPREFSKSFMTKLVMGTATVGRDPILGYMKTHDELQNAIMEIRWYFSRYTNNLSPLMPTVPPCFNT